MIVLLIAPMCRDFSAPQSLVEVGAASKEEREEQLAAQEEQRQVERQAVQDSLQALRDQEEKIALEVATFASAVEELRAQVQSSSDEMKSQNQLQSQTQDRLQEDLDNLVEKVRKHKGQFKEGQQVQGVSSSCWHVTSVPGVDVVKALSFFSIC